MRILLCLGSEDSQSPIADWLREAFPAASIIWHTEYPSPREAMEAVNPNLLLVSQSAFESDLLDAANLQCGTRMSAVLVLENSSNSAPMALLTCADAAMNLSELDAARLVRTCHLALIRRRASLVYPRPPKNLTAFCATYAHDVKAQSRHIRQLCGILHTDLKSRVAFTDSEKESVALIKTATENMDRYVEGLRQFLHIPAEIIKTEVVPITSLFAETEKTFAGCDIAKTLEDKSLAVVGDRAALQMMLDQLIENAIKFTQDKPQITLIAKRTPNTSCIEIIVTDQGIGIPPQDQERIFTPFTHLHNLEQFPGAGLGLATVERVVNLHNGAINVESQTDQGSTFRVTLAEHQRSTGPSS